MPSTTPKSTARVTASELRRDSSAVVAVRRILLEWIAVASALLNKKNISDTDIHAARKQLKKARAALRLLRGSLGEIAYQRENAALRDAARPLGIARDSRVLVAALDALVTRDRAASKQQSPDAFRRALRNEQTRARQALTPTVMRKQRAVLTGVTKRSERWRLQAEDWALIGDGLMRIYRGGRKKFAKAKVSRDTEHLHDWRKQVKYLWHQLQILRPLRPAKLGELAAQCHELADCLGDDHDLAVLRQAIEGHARDFDRTRDLDKLLRRLDRRRIHLQDKAFALGSRIFADKPRVFAQRLRKYWKAWRNIVPA